MVKVRCTSIHLVFRLKATLIKKYYNIKYIAGKLFFICKIYGQSCNFVNIFYVFIKVLSMILGHLLIFVAFEETY